MTYSAAPPTMLTVPSNIIVHLRSAVSVTPPERRALLTSSLREREVRALALRGTRGVAGPGGGRGAEDGTGYAADAARVDLEPRVDDARDGARRAGRLAALGGRVFRTSRLRPLLDPERGEVQNCAP